MLNNNIYNVRITQFRKISNTYITNILLLIYRETKRNYTFYQAHFFKISNKYIIK